MKFKNLSFYEEITLLNIFTITTTYKLLWRIRPCNIGEVPSLMEIFKLWAIKKLPVPLIKKISP